MGWCDKLKGSYLGAGTNESEVNGGGDRWDTNSLYETLDMVERAKTKRDVGGCTVRNADGYGTQTGTCHN